FLSPACNPDDCGVMERISFCAVGGGGIPGEPGRAGCVMALGAWGPHHSAARAAPVNPRRGILGTVDSGWLLEVCLRFPSTPPVFGGTTARAFPDRPVPHSVHARVPRFRPCRLRTQEPPRRVAQGRRA